MYMNVYVCVCMLDCVYMGIRYIIVILIWSCVWMGVGYVFIIGMPQKATEYYWMVIYRAGKYSLWQYKDSYDGMMMMMTRLMIITVFINDKDSLVFILCNVYIWVFKLELKTPIHNMWWHIRTVYTHTSIYMSIYYSDICNIWIINSIFINMILIYRYIFPGFLYL